MGNSKSSSGPQPSSSRTVKTPSAPSHSTSQPNFNTASKTGVLQLKDKGLSQVPIALKDLTILTTMELSGNNFSELPPWIGSLINMKNLTVNNNRLTTLPEDIGNWAKLQKLSIKSNKLASLPTSLSQCTALKEVKLSGNVLAVFPGYLCDLPNLDLLDLAGNRIRSLPDNVGGLTVIELDLSRNQLSDLNDGLVSCSRLKVLRLEENCLPLAAFTETIMKNSCFSSVTVEGNTFQEKEFHHLPGYEEYMERFTAMRRKQAI